MPPLSDAKAAIESNYNNYISVYEFDDYLKFTNGSAGWYIIIRLTDDGFRLTGELYDRTVDKQCEPSTDALLETLQSTV
jgi:hypothetical protein